MSEKSFCPAALTNYGFGINGLNPCMAVEEEVLKRIGLTREEAFELDTMNIYKNVHELAFIYLVNAFYRRIYNDPDPNFRNLFKSSLDKNVERLGGYLIQRFGGSVGYSNKRGVPNLPVRHWDLVPMMTEEFTNKWLNYMKEALDECHEEFTTSQIKIIFNHLKFQAYLILAHYEYREFIANKTTLF